MKLIDIEAPDSQAKREPLQSRDREGISHQYPR